jgi:hypothetical protein
MVSCNIPHMLWSEYLHYETVVLDTRAESSKAKMPFTKDKVHFAALTFAIQPTYPGMSFISPTRLKKPSRCPGAPHKTHHFYVCLFWVKRLRAVKSTTDLAVQRLRMFVELYLHSAHTSTWCGAQWSARENFILWLHKSQWKIFEII